MEDGLAIKPRVIGKGCQENRSSTSSRALATSKAKHHGFTYHKARKSHTTKQKGEPTMEIRIKILLILAAGLIAVAWSQSALAQGQPSASGNIAVQIANARKANAALMRQYTWDSRTEIIEEGAVKDIRIEAVSYGPGGQLQRSLLKDEAMAQPVGFLGWAIARKRKERLEAYLKGLQSLLDQYTLPTEAKVVDFVNQAAAAKPDARGLIWITGSNVLLPGDNLSIWIDAATLQTRKTQVNTFYEGQAVNLTGTFKTLASGLTYAAFTQVNIPGKQFSVQVQNYDYNRTVAASSPQIKEQKLPPATTVAPSPPIQERQISPSITEMEIKSPAPTPAAPSATGTPSFQTAEQKLKDLKALFDQGLISQSDYDAKKAQILQGL
jgi:hypothetical protein